QNAVVIEISRSRSITFTLHTANLGQGAGQSRKTLSDFRGFSIRTIFVQDSEANASANHQYHPLRCGVLASCFNFSTRPGE
ncbi:MAG: hypothetical protein ACKVT0_05495, partial [Planctomycetaceae bacterium]